MLHLLFLSLIFGLTIAQEPIQGLYALPAIQPLIPGQNGLNQLQIPVQSQYALPAIQTMQLPGIQPLQPATTLTACGIPACGLPGQTQVGYTLGTDGNYFPQAAPAAAPAAAGGTAVASSEGGTTKAPPNRFNEAGWETDDNGNVYVGDDNAKLYLISVGSFWPFPKDYRKKREIHCRSIEQLVGFDKL